MRAVHSCISWFILRVGLFPEGFADHGSTQEKMLIDKISEEHEGVLANLNSTLFMVEAYWSVSLYIDLT